MTGPAVPGRGSDGEGRAGRYVPWAELGDSGQTWRCLDCDLVARRKGYSDGSVARITDRVRHDEWHERQPFGGLAL